MASTIFLDYVMHLQDKQLADEAHWCRQYAKINAVALRKILEQHDRMLHNSSGRRLLQVNLECCCDRGLACAAFLLAVYRSYAIGQAFPCAQACQALGLRSVVLVELSPPDLAVTVCRHAGMNQPTSANCWTPQVQISCGLLCWTS